MKCTIMIFIIWSLTYLLTSQTNGTKELRKLAIIELN